MNEKDYRKRNGIMRECVIPGSARVPRAGLGVPPRRTFFREETFKSAPRHSNPAGKFVAAGRGNQHAGRVRYPETPFQRHSGRNSLPWFALVSLLFICSCAASIAAPTDWAIADAPFRVGVQLRKAPSAPEFGTAINLPDAGLTRPDLSDVQLLGPDQKPVPIAKIGHRPGGRLILLAQNLEPRAQYFLYFGGNKTRVSPTWTPKISLLMETRPAPNNLRFDSLESVKSAWTQSGEEPGADFVEHIYQGGNPFGPNTQFLSHYTGYLNVPEAKAITFYTLSSDCSFVLINDQLQVSWPGRHSPRANQKEAPQKAVTCPAGLVKVEYYAAKGDVPEGDHLEAAMVLGWKNASGAYQTVPPSAWMHAGDALITTIQRADGQWQPLPEIRVESMAGHANRWLYEISYNLGEGLGLRQRPNASLSEPAPPWTANWEFEDGATSAQVSGRRILTGGESQLVKCKLSRPGESLRLLFRVDIPDRLQRASINNPDDVRHLIDTILCEKVSSQDSLRVRLGFLCEFGTDQDLAKFASQWPNHAPDDPLWVSARLAAIRLLGQTDPAQARQELTNLSQALPPDMRQNYSIELANTEMDLLVFCAKDPAAFDRLGQIGFLNNANNLSKLAKIRAGDLHRLLGHYKEATEQYKLLAEKTDPKTYPVKDRAESIAIRDLLDQGLPQNAKFRLQDWELRHPMAKFDSDFLLLRARTLIGLGRWSEAQAELESFQKVQPDSPFLIDAQFYQARILFEKNQKEEARKIWNTLAKDYPKHPLADEAKHWAAKP